MRIMHALAKKAKRFSLLFLEEGEIYTRDCMGFRFHSMFPERRQEKGRIHICSRSLIFEPEDVDTPVIKYCFRDMPISPDEVLASASLYGTETKPRLHCQVRKVTILPDTRCPDPYQVLKLTDPQDVSFEFLYEAVASVTKWVQDLYSMNSGHHAGFDHDSELAALVAQREQGMRFDMTRVESIAERPLTPHPLLVKRIHPFMHLAGLLYLTDACLYFQPVYRVSSKLVKSVKYREISKLYKRRWKLRNVGFELFMTDRKSMFLTFDSEFDRDQIFSHLISRVSPGCETESSVEDMSLRWRNREISNFDYLMYLNSAAYRTFSDFTQYPILPWVVRDYESETLDLTNPNSFRDLRKPIGALNQRRLDTFKQRYADMPPPKFLYGTHYSAPGYVIGLLIRKQPLYMLRLHVITTQAGKYDSPDRLFDDIQVEWNSVNENPADVKELIPEFYGTDVSFLCNELKLKLGTRQSGRKVWDVRLPPWASNATDFLAKMREALESDYVSDNLHHWIDLVFGYKQRGEHAIEADNGTLYAVFHPLTYEGSVDIERITDPTQKRAIEIQINEFGQTPKQLFKIPHPPRSATGASLPAQVAPSESFIWRIDKILSKRDSRLTEIPLHNKRISSIHICEDKAVTTGFDGCVKVVPLDRFQKRSFSVSELALSCSSLLSPKQVICGSYNHKLYLFSLALGRVQETINAHEDAISCCEYLSESVIPTQNLLASASWDGYLKLWDFRANKLKPVQQFEEHEEKITAMCVDRTRNNPHFLATADLEGNIILRDIRMPDNYREISRIYTHAGVTCMRHSLHSDHLLVAMSVGLTMYEKNGAEAGALPVPNCAAFDTDGVFALTGGEEGILELWDLMKATRIHAWDRVCNVTSTVVSADGDFFLAGNADGVLYHIK